MLKNKRVFISGGSGVIGRELVKKLVQNEAIVMVGDLVEIPSDFPSSVVYRRGDLNYITQQELDSFNPHVFFHLAATFERSTESYGHWEENFWHNIRLSNHLMTLVRNIPSIERVVYASSYLIYNKELYIYDEAREVGSKLKETDPIAPRNLTGLAKLAHELELEFLANYKSDKFTSICARIYRGYGKNSRDVISRWIRDLLSDKKIFVYRPEGIFDFVYAEDTAEGLLKLSQTNFAGIVNLGSGKSRKVSDVVNVLKENFPTADIEYVESDIKFEASEADTTKLLGLINWAPNQLLENTIPELIKFEKNRVNNSSSHSNILITSVSKKIPLIEAVKKAAKKISSDILVFGGDLNKNCLGKYFVDSFWEMPSLKNLGLPDLLKFCDDNKIGLIIPTRDGELEFFSNYKDELERNGVGIMISNKKSIINCIDKLLFSQIDGIHAIPAFLGIEDVNASTYVVKEQFGAGSMSIGINLGKEDAIRHAKNLKHPLFQPFVHGYEISVDAYITKDSTIKGIVMRRRDLVVDGESQVTSTFTDLVLEEKFIEILSRLDLYGHVILQAIIDDKNVIHVIECNPRFGGASTLSLQAGLDSFYWSYLEANGYSLANYPFFRSQKELVQVRHAKDYYL